MAPAFAEDRLRIALQKTGTAAWELAVIRHFGLDKAAGLDLAVTELATTEAGKIAIAGGAADIIISDWLWVSRERALGRRLTFYPYSSAIGAVMAPAGSSIRAYADLVGKKIGVAGGPLDKSWLLLQAAALQAGVDLKSKAQIQYGAPALLAEKTAQGELDATLNFWNFCADLETRGFVRAIDMAAVERDLGARAPVPVTGYVFDEDWARAHAGLVARFIAMTDKAKALMQSSDEAWSVIAPLTHAKSPAALAVYRRRFVEGVSHRPLEAQQADAAALYDVLAKMGGETLVGPSQNLQPGVFFSGDGSH
ncbi:MAG: ABC transporter substrate-binding protein [Hyphomicrobiales bacterium]|nr:ABC transporter substrate-binding protein [Hyphomicrobiales bacterium]